MNAYNKKGIDFLNVISLLLSDKGRKNCDALFDVLDKLSLKEGYHLGLKLANEEGLGQESSFFTFGGDCDQKVMKILAPYEFDFVALLKDLVFSPSKMTAWQLYLLFISPTVLPTFWHGGYIHRRFFFGLSDKKEYVDIEPIYRQSFWLKTKIIPEPSVELKDGKYIVKCAYWSDWQGLVLETFKCAFLEKGKVKLYRPTQRVLYKYNCGILF